MIIPPYYSNIYTLLIGRVLKSFLFISIKSILIIQLKIHL